MLSWKIMLYSVMNSNGTEQKNIEQEGCSLIPNPHLHVCSFLFLLSSTYIRMKDINNYIVLIIIITVMIMMMMMMTDDWWKG